MRIASVGHAIFAATLVFIGILGFVKGDFIQIWLPVPKELPARELLVYLCACIPLVCGFGFCWPRTQALAARLLLAYFLLWWLLFKMRFIFIAPLTEGVYQSNGQNAVWTAAAWVLYAWFATDWDRRYLCFATGERGLRIARFLYSLAMLAFGFSHFAYFNLTAPIVPGWLPWHAFWAYFTGVAYLAAGAGMLSGVYVRLAATLSAVQIGGFTLLVWPTLVAAGTITASQWGEFTASAVLTASAWMVADSHRGMSWFAVGKR